jgi:myo-inositol 2-dehydrogenase / D-chiro-inositol 1-dehydrogenase
MIDLMTVGIIGAGRIGQLHVNNLKRIPGIRIKMIADIQADAITQWAKDHAIEVVTKDPQHIINDPEIEAVLICSPTTTHAELIKKCARAKKHIFCEKPISFSTLETEEALKIVEEEGVILQVGFNRRFDQNFRTVKEKIAQGEIGRVHTLKITSRDPYPPSPSYIKTSGGLFMDMMIHDFDMARFITQSEIVEVFVKGTVLIDEQIAACDDIDTAMVLLTFENGAIGVIENSRKSAFGYDQRLEVFGSEGALQVDNNRPNNITKLTAEGVQTEKPYHFFLERYTQAYIDEMLEFYKTIKTGAPIVCSGQDGYAAEVIAEACKESLITGKAVSLKGSEVHVTRQ